MKKLYKLLTTSPVIGCRKTVWMTLNEVENEIDGLIS